MSKETLGRDRPPKWRKAKIEVYKPDECERLLRVAHEDSSALPWDVLIYTAIITGMRRGELLNLAWADVDFETKQIHVSPKPNAAETWEWLIKDTDSRDLPLTDEAVSMLAEHQAKQPDRYAHVFFPDERYKAIQKLRRQGTWTLSDARLKVINNFRRKYEKIQKLASVRLRRFHDLRNTAVTNWLANGMSEYEVMRLGGHASFEMTHKFYLAMADDLVDRARAAASAGMGLNLACIWRASAFSGKRD